MLSIDENAKIKLVPFYIKQEGDNFLIVKKENLTILKTSEVGIKVANLLAKSHTINEIKDILSREYNIDKSTINVNPLLETFVENRYIYAIGDEILVESRKNKWYIQIKFFFSSITKLQLFHFIYYSIPIRISYIFMRKIIFKNIHIHEDIKNRINESLYTVYPFINNKNNIQDIAEANVLLLKQIEFDKVLFFNLGYKNLSTWLDKYFVIENIDTLYKNFERNKGIILCGFHSGSYNVLPCVLAKNHLEIHTPVIFEQTAHQMMVERIKKIDKEAFPFKLHIYRRGKYDGQRLFYVLKKGGIILLFCDTHRIFTDDVVEVKFYNQKIITNRGVAFFHKKTNAPIMPVLTYNQGAYCYIKFLDVISDMQTFTEGEIMQKLFSILQNLITNSPENWAKWADLREMNIGSMH